MPTEPKSALNVRTLLAAALLLACVLASLLLHGGSGTLRHAAAALAVGLVGGGAARWEAARGKAPAGKRRAIVTPIVSALALGATFVLVTPGSEIAAHPGAALLDFGVGAAMGYLFARVAASSGAPHRDHDA
jgi:hypothetical protein